MEACKQSGPPASVLVLAVTAEKKSCSPVWAYFEIDSAKQKGTCRPCAKQLTYKPDGGTTSNLLKHMSAMHASVWNKSKAEGEKGMFSSSKRGTLDSFFKKMVCPAGQRMNTIVDMIALDLHPAAIVEGVGFHRLMQVADPGYRVPLRTFISFLLQKKHQDGLEKLRILLESMTGVSLTTDMWTSHAMEGYITVTAHFIAEDWTQRSLVLANAGFVQHHTAKNISKKLVDITDDMRITRKVVALTQMKLPTSVLLCMTHMQLLLCRAWTALRKALFVPHTGCKHALNTLFKRKTWPTSSRMHGSLLAIFAIV